MVAPAQSRGIPARPLAGIACMVAAGFLYSGFDAITKWLVADYAPFQILFFRATFAFLPWLLWVAREPAPARVIATAQPGFQILRGLLGFCSFTCFALAFRVLPLAVAVAVAYSAPLYTTALARPLLGERVGGTRWLVVLFGFAGVLVIAHPATGNIPSGVAWAVAGSVLYALAALATRRLGRSDRAPTTMFYSMTIYTLLAAVLLPFVWQTPQPVEWIGFAAIGIIGGIAQFFLFQAYRLAPAATVSPFEYTILAWGTVWGFVVWHEWPGDPSLAGMLMIALAGLALVRHERRLQSARSGD